MSQDSVDQGVDTGDTSVTEESTSQVESSEAEAQESAPEKQEEKPAPFHEHPRFKELIEQNRESKQRADEYQQSLRTLQAQMEAFKHYNSPKKEEAPKDPFLADLEKVNPAYAKSLEAAYQKASKVDQLEAKLQQYETQQFQEKAVNHFNKILESFKVTDTFNRDIYQYAIRAAVDERERRGERLGLKDLDTIANDFHAKFTKHMEDNNRKLTASYVKEKASDKTPKGTTGGVPSAPGAKKMAAGDITAQAKWLADRVRAMKKEH